METNCIELFLAMNTAEKDEDNRTQVHLLNPQTKLHAISIYTPETIRPDLSTNLATLKHASP